MNSIELQQLVERYLAGQCTAEETGQLRQMLKEPACQAVLEEIMDRQLAENSATKDQYPEVVRRLQDSVGRAIAEEHQVARVYRLRLRRRWAVAASILLIAGAFTFWQLYKFQAPKQGDVATGGVPSHIDIAPGQEGAILTLADGSTIILDSLGNGIVTNQDGTKVLLNNGQLTYAGNTADAMVAYNTMTTPKGRQFRLVLQDGTKVWLNAASSIRYPIVFTGKERVVEVTGEAYFEVAKNAQMPFHVKVNDETEIEVLGTHFNVNSYANESSINTTLLEGSVRISSRGENVVIRPGEQARVDNRPSSLKIDVISRVNIDKVMAWKNGVFNFQDATLHEVMRQLERWYDIEVIYEKGVPEQEFIGKMGRDLSLAEVLRGLEVSEVHFRILEDRKLVVMP